ncbi:MAG: hypothetical protein ACR2RF_05980 [Geminicoccaceae bacterium]
MRYLALIPLALLIGACALLQSTTPAHVVREKVVDGVELYCTQPLAVREQNREWINENSPHTIQVTCAGDLPPTS